MNSNHIFLFVLCCVFIYMMFGMSSCNEGFANTSKQDGWDLTSHTSYENAHGSAPAGVNALPGESQYRQNAESHHVALDNRTGNSQNTHSSLKKQPAFAY